MKMLLAALMLLAAPAFASAPPFFGYQMFPSSATQYLSGRMCLAASTTTAGTCNVLVDGASPGNITLLGGVVATGNVSAGGLFGPLFGAYTTDPSSFTVLGANGILTGSSVTANSFFGDGSHLTGISGSLSGGTTGKSAFWTASNTQSAGFLSETASSGTVLSGNTLQFNSGATLLLRPGATSNVPVFLSSQTFTTAASFTISLGAANFATVQCDITIKQITSPGNAQIQFEGDTTSGHYGYVIQSWTLNAGSGVNADSTTFIFLTGNSIRNSAIGHTSFSYIPTNLGTTTEIKGTAGYIDSAGHQNLDIFAGTWTGGTSPANATITTSGGTMTGFARCSSLNY